MNKKRIFSGNRDSAAFDRVAERHGLFVGSDGRTHAERSGYRIVDWFGPINGRDYPNGVDIDWWDD
jgi:hypothetical protein